MAQEEVVTPDNIDLDDGEDESPSVSIASVFVAAMGSSQPSKKSKSSSGVSGPRQATLAQTTSGVPNISDKLYSSRPRERCPRDYGLGSDISDSSHDDSDTDEDDLTPMLVIRQQQWAGRQQVGQVSVLHAKRASVTKPVSIITLDKRWVKRWAFSSEPIAHFIEIKGLVMVSFVLLDMLQPITQSSSATHLETTPVMALGFPTSSSRRMPSNFRDQSTSASNFQPHHGQGGLAWRPQTRAQSKKITRVNQAPYLTKTTTSFRSNSTRRLDHYKR
ncbi:hypothetical protein GOP47_0017685, partial [Adiantum capillus-veneris]